MPPLPSLIRVDHSLGSSTSIPNVRRDVWTNGLGTLSPRRARASGNHSAPRTFTQACRGRTAVAIRNWLWNDSGGLYVPHDDAPERVRRPHPVVGVGASAGGLEAFQELIANIKPEHGCAWVLVQHLDPDHSSLLPELLSRRSHVSVRVITDGMTLEAGALHLIPPGAELTMKDGALHLASFDAPRGLRRPIDVFFESLAADMGSDCAAVVLSGTGSDGALGIRAVKEAGGLVFVQDPKQAKYDGMPKSALATHAVDLVLPAGDIATVLEEYFDRRLGLEPRIENDAQFIDRVTRHIRYRTGHDFSHYKKATLLRRLARRMSVVGMHSPASYLQRLIGDPSEAPQIFRDILINVTSFFRDASSFDALQTHVLAELVRGKRRDDEVRVWVPGCSSGQEAYSIAMLIEEELQRADVRPKVSIFATDIDPDALAIAREGTFPHSIVAELPQHLLERYFKITSHGYQVVPKIRDMVRVSQQSLIKDPPFSKINLISCRNLLIYFDAHLQERVFEIFQYSLVPGGYLFLGQSENVSAGNDAFQSIMKSDRLYRRRPGPPRGLMLPLDAPLGLLDAGDTLSGPIPDFRHSSELYERAVLAKHAPPYAVVNSRRDIVYTSPRTRRFLELPGGRVNLSLFDMVDAGLKPALRGLLASVGDEPGNVRMRELKHGSDGEERGLILTAERLTDDNILIVFQDTFDPRRSSDPDDPQTIDQSSYTDSYVHELERKLDSAYQTIRTTVEELETSNEELKSSNEEMMSMNEELQSANEELSTINEELQSKVVELHVLNDDQRNLIDSTGIATLFLDRDLRLRSFTPTASRYFRLLQQDAGRPFEDLSTELDGEPIATLCRQAMDTGKRIETHRSSRDGRADLLISLSPYISNRDQVGGVVLTMTEITELKQYARRLEEARADAQLNLTEIEELYRVTPQAKALLDEHHRFRRVNQRFADLSGYPIEHHKGRLVHEVVPQLSSQVSEGTQKVLAIGETTTYAEISSDKGNDESGRRMLEIDWYPVLSGKAVHAIGMNIRDVTKHKTMELELRRLMRELQHRVKNMLANVTALINRARREKGDPRDVLLTLVQRIQALAKTHNLLTSQNWRPSLIEDVLRPELTAVYGEERITLKGPALRVNSRTTLALGMAIHELATNAAKYGALSSDHGRLCLSWSRLDDGDGERIVLHWVETGGPSVSPPSNIGFGSQLVRTTIEKSLGGRLECSFAPAGFKATVEIPFERATEEPENATDEMEDLQSSLR